ncbi:hypothetical protein MTO96_048986 [Rhipicephalus appendiculatus]
MRIPLVVFLLTCVSADDDGKRLNIFVQRYEPMYYRPEPEGHTRAKRSVEAVRGRHVNLQLRTSKRALNLRLTP